MFPLYLNPTGYTSCIKIAGTSILPPLVTEDRKPEISTYKARAIEVEQRLKRKRSSIDSGVMTGSYIEHFKNSEELQIEQGENISVYQSIVSDSGCNENTDPNILSSTASQTSFPSDNFLKSALEDEEFRELFFNTAQKIFGDSRLVSTDQNENFSSSVSFPVENKDNVLLETHDTNPNKFDSINLTTSVNTTASLDSSTRNAYSDVSVYNIKKPNKSCPEGTSFENQPIIQVQVGDTLSPPRRIRRNSYTLESPSPVLLEHMAKENAEKMKNNNKWKPVSEKKIKDKGLGFKTFLSARKPRKMWKKNNKDMLIADVVTPKLCDKKTISRFFNKNCKMFLRNDKPSLSLPSSSRTSPIHFSTARSLDCIQSNLIENSGINFDLISKPIAEVRMPLGIDSDMSITTCKAVIESDLSPRKIESANSTTHWLDNTNNSIISTCETDILHPPHVDPGDSVSQISVVSHSTMNKPEVDLGSNIYSINQPQRTELTEVDESISVSSSLSLSKFGVIDDNLSRPTTAENLTVLFSELQLRHERQLAELLKQQHHEKIMLSKLHTNISPSRSTTSTSVPNLPYEGSNSPLLQKQPSCSRNLFPNQKDYLKLEEHDPEIQKAAAIKITAFARGYLTRRLLKTQRVQQLIDVIKESLNCAFTLQSETHLKKNDLDLHERLAHQLTSALYELQTIISAPVKRRMAIIAVDREKLRNPPSRPSSAVSSATQKRKLRKQQSLITSDNKTQDRRYRTKSLCLSGAPVSGLVRSSSFIKSETSVSNSRRPWK